MNRIVSAFSTVLLCLIVLSSCTKTKTHDNILEDSSIETSQSEVVTCVSDYKKIPITLFENKIVVTEPASDNIKADLYIRADIHYPSISMPSNVNMEILINKTLRYVPLKLVGQGFFENDGLIDGLLIPNWDGFSLFKWSGNTSYDIKFICQEYISIVYNGNVSDGTRLWRRLRLLTINLSTGTVTPLDEIVDENSVKYQIEEGEFEVLEGGYSPGGWDEKDVDIRHAFADAFEMSYMNQEKTSDSTFIEENSSENFAFDDQFVYILFPFEDSLDGYVLIKLDR